MSDLNWTRRAFYTKFKILKFKVKYSVEKMNTTL